MAAVLHIGRFHFVCSFPYFAQTNCAMEAIEDGQWHRNVSYYRPSPKSVEIQLNRMTLSSRFFQCANGPHCQICHQQKSHYFSSRLFAHVFGWCCIPSTCIQNKHGLNGSLNNRSQRCDQHETCTRCDIMFSHRKMTTNDRKSVKMVKKILILEVRFCIEALWTNEMTLTCCIRKDHFDLKTEKFI